MQFRNDTRRMPSISTTLYDLPEQLNVTDVSLQEEQRTKAKHAVAALYLSCTTEDWRPFADKRILLGHSSCTHEVRFCTTGDS